jgi:microcystin-dependent protein
MATFVRISSISNIYTSLAGLITQVSSLAVVPSGMISMWRGTVPPTGWTLCNGSNGTPDLRGKFIVGYHPGDADYNLIDKTGGEKKHTLITSETPEHFHTMGTRDSETGYSSGPNKEFVADYNYSGSGSGGTVRSSPIGGNQPHENRPPYYTLAYIMKL